MSPQPQRKRHHLSSIELDEISLVDRPANKGARVALFKRDEAPDMQNVDAIIAKFTGQSVETVSTVGRIHAAVEDVRAAHPGMSYAAALTKHIEANPADFDALEKAEGRSVRAPEGISKALTDAAAVMRRTYPHLTREQAMAKAMAEDPSLYEG
ncbi:hypothetical protein [Methylobacterium sp. J-070]|uniref:hypothetical protein n=1 Tax=Methylobacterium sp. J-070 TaxID=2836650 RepID=UPI001FB8A58A|nr:hypothetical protein [Methylobacterium sp. J-070]MCJ2048530.1 hypothetical protein [Methylobacterium sp. J-070]